MDKLQAIITHINASVKNRIDRETMVSCIKCIVRPAKWSYHINTFFLETPISLMHDIVLAGIFSFEELYVAYQKWAPEGYADNETTQWIKEMYYLQMGRAHELGPDYFA